jgi:hypothetical protein
VHGRGVLWRLDHQGFRGLIKARFIRVHDEPLGLTITVHFSGSVLCCVEQFLTRMGERFGCLRHVEVICPVLNLRVAGKVLYHG